MVHSVLKRLKAASGDENPGSLTYREITFFYSPLALTSLLFLSAHSIVTFFVARAKWPLNPWRSFRDRGLNVHLQEHRSLLPGSGHRPGGDRFEKFFPLRNFALLLVSAVFCFFGLVVFTDLVRICDDYICGLSPDLTHFALGPTKIMMVLPVLEVVMSFQRGLMVAGLTTKPVTLGALVEIITIVLILNLAIHSFNMVGAMAAAVALVTGRTAANLFLLYPNYLLFRSIKKRKEE